MKKTRKSWGYPDGFQSLFYDPESLSVLCGLGDEELK
jgi:hypothetical protein